jgi:tellurite resistance protein TerC
MSTAVWQVTIIVLLAVLAFDLALAIIRRNKETSMREAAIWTAVYVSSAILFGYSLGEWNTTQARSEFFAGWITEYSLSIDNLFIFILILARFKVDKTKQQLILLVGIILALILRGIFIALGAAAISRYTWVFYIFGAFLLYTAYKLISESGEKEWKEGHVITWFRNRGASPILIVLVAIAFTDLVFALDSIPAIFGLTQDPYIVFTANAFALMGLRQLYFLLGGLMTKLIYLTKGLAIILGFIGVKLIIEALHGGGTHKVMGIEIPEISTEFSLSVIIGTLFMTTVLSLVMSSKREKLHDQKKQAKEKPE